MRADTETIARAEMKGLTVATVMRETMGLTMAFVTWYLREGADQIVICFDDPADPAIAALEPFPQVYCVPCTAEFWGTLGISPYGRFARRQNRAMNFVYQSLAGGWFMTVDGDELVHLDGRTLAQELASTPADTKAVTVLPAESIQSPDAPDALQFRLPMSREAVHEVYGDCAPLMSVRQGLSGHRAGKTATRVGIPNVHVRQHFVQGTNGDKLIDRVIGAADAAYLLHFFDQGFAVWRAKLPWRLASHGYPERGRKLLQQVLAEADPEPGLREIYAKMHIFDAGRRALLAQHGALFEMNALRAQSLARAVPSLAGAETEARRFAA